MGAMPDTMQPAPLERVPTAVVVRGASPLIWRRLLVPAYTTSSPVRAVRMAWISWDSGSDLRTRPTAPAATALRTGTGRTSAVRISTCGAASSARWAQRERPGGPFQARQRGQPFGVRRGPGPRGSPTRAGPVPRRRRPRRRARRPGRRPRNAARPGPPADVLVAQAPTGRPRERVAEIAERPAAPATWRVSADFRAVGWRKGVRRIRSGVFGFPTRGRWCWWGGRLVGGRVSRRGVRVGW